MKKRVVITGIGVISPIGSNPEEFWQSLLNGKSGIDKVTIFDTKGFDVNFGGEVKNFDPAKYIDAKEATRTDRFAQFALAAALEAVKDAGIDFSKCDRSRCGSIIGSGIGGLAELQESHSRFLQRGPTKMSPFFVPKLMVNSAPGKVAIKHGICGPNFAVSSACSSANHALGLALKTIQYGDADVMISGGAEAALTSLGLSGFACMGAVSKRNDNPQAASRPFEKNRDGFVLGEGSAIFILENLEHARKRDAKIYAELLGFGQSDDAFHITAPDPDGTGAALSMKNALNDASLRPEDISYINAHGTSTKLNDKVETMAIKKLFNDNARKVPVSSTKSMTGHLLGAAAAVELLACIMSIRDNKVHPTINYEEPDPECDLDYVPNVKRDVQVDYAISNSLGFGGHNTTLVVGRFKP